MMEIKNESVKQSVLGVLLSVAMLSCASDKTDNANGGDIPPKGTHELKSEAAEKRASEVGAVLILDTVSMTYSAQFDSYLDKAVFAREMYIHDIFRENGSTYATAYINHIRAPGMAEIFLVLRIDSVYVSEFIRTVAPENSNESMKFHWNGLLGPYMAKMKIYDIRKMNMHFRSISPDDYNSASIEGSPSRTYAGRGELIELYGLED
jgi:hypothetical protein